MTGTTPQSERRASQRPDEVSLEKARLRADARAKRREHPLSQAAAALRLERAWALARRRQAIATYASTDDEPDTLELIERARGHGIRVLLPVLTGRREPAWAWYTGPDALRPGFRGIPEPTGEALGPDALAECSFILTSALLVTPFGDRLGTGGGWWDRALAHRAADATVGVLVSESEIVRSLPADPWDVPIDIIVTEQRAAAVITGVDPE